MSKETLINALVAVVLAILLLVVALYGVIGVEILIAKYLGVGLPHLATALLAIITVITVRKDL